MNRRFYMQKREACPYIKPEKQVQNRGSVSFFIYTSLKPNERPIPYNKIRLIGNGGKG